MLPTVAETTTVVKPGYSHGVDNCRRRRQDRPMSVRESLPKAKPLEECETTTDRLVWVLHEMADEVGTGSEWALRSGLSRGTVYAVIRRGKHGDKSDLSKDTAEALALSAGISAAWLQFGTGSPDDGIAGENDPYPARAQAIMDARGSDTISRSAMVMARRLEGKRFEKMTKEQWRAELLEMTVKQLRRRTG